MTEVTEVKSIPDSQNTFLQCPKCTRLHDVRVLICENVKCKFSHQFPNGVEVTAEAGLDKSGAVSVSVPVGTGDQTGKPEVITPPDPTAGGAP